MAEHDASGALPVHALLIANTDTSVELAFQWFMRPAIMTNPAAEIRANVKSVMSSTIGGP